VKQLSSVIRKPLHVQTPSKQGQFSSLWIQLFSYFNNYVVDRNINVDVSDADSVEDEHDDDVCVVFIHFAVLAVVCLDFVFVDQLIGFTQQMIDVLHEITEIETELWFDKGNVIQENKKLFNFVMFYSTPNRVYRWMQQSLQLPQWKKLLPLQFEVGEIFLARYFAARLSIENPVIFSPLFHCNSSGLLLLLLCV
jgi:hypothetical protein